MIASQYACTSVYVYYKQTNARTNMRIIAYLRIKMNVHRVYVKHMVDLLIVGPPIFVSSSSSAFQFTISVLPLYFVHFIFRSVFMLDIPNKFNGIKCEARTQQMFPRGYSLFGAATTTTNERAASERWQLILKIRMVRFSQRLILVT